MPPLDLELHVDPFSKECDTIIMNKDIEDKLAGEEDERFKKYEKQKAQYQEQVTRILEEQSQRDYMMNIWYQGMLF